MTDTITDHSRKGHDTARIYALHPDYSTHSAITTNTAVRERLFTDTEQRTSRGTAPAHEGTGAPAQTHYGRYTNFVAEQDRIK